MSQTHLKQTVHDLKDRIKKTLASLETDREMMIDALKVLETLDLDLQVISTSGIGPTVREVIKVSKEKKIDAVTEIANRIMSAWKAKGGANKPTSAPSSAAAVTSTSVPPPVAQYPDNDLRKSRLPAKRSATVGIISQQLLKKGMDNKAAAEHWALNIEEAVNRLHNFENEKQKYTDKIKSISFNLGKNQELLGMVIKGELSCEKLVHLSPAELASQKVKEERQQIVNEEVSSRRLDQEEVYRKEIHAELGIDANDAWQYEQDDDAKSEPDMEPPDS